MRTLTFFSYKGGAGRTTLTYNLIPLLCRRLGASPQNPLVVVDLDIDSMGMTYLLNCNVRKDNAGEIDPCEGNKTYVEEVLKNGLSRVGDEKPLQSLKRALVPVGNKFLRDDEEILFLRAKGGTPIIDANKSNNYIADDSNERNLKNRFLKSCKDAGCAGVVFDSAVGDQATAQYGNSLADTIVCCMRPTRQFTIGTEDFLHRTDGNYAGKYIVLVPNVVTMEEMVIDGYRYPSTGKSDIITQFENADWMERSNNHYVKKMFEGQNFGIPKVDRFMWKEDLLNVLKNRTEQENAALKGYELLAKVICDIDV